MMVSVVEIRKAGTDEGFDRIVDDGLEVRMAATHDPLRVVVRRLETGVSLEVDGPHVKEALAKEFSLAAKPDLFEARDRHELHRFLRTALRMSRSLPTAPLMAFKAKTMGMPRSTEVERMSVQRVGQDIFRKALMDFWDGRCPMTGISDPALLRASHIVPWADCMSDAERLDVYNGLLLSSLFDAAFDAHLMTFDEDGNMMASELISVQALDYLQVDRKLPLRSGHHDYMARHRATFDASFRRG